MLEVLQYVRMFFLQRNRGGKSRCLLYTYTDMCNAKFAQFSRRLTRMRAKWCTVNRLPPCMHNSRRIPGLGRVANGLPPPKIFKHFAKISHSILMYYYILRATIK